METTGVERLISIPGVLNFRDTGGFPTEEGRRVATGLLYRSASLAQLTPAGAQALAALGLRTVVDLRSPRELEVWPNRPHDLDVALVNLPTFPPRFPSQEVDSQEVDGEATTDGDAEAGEETLEGLYAFLADTSGPAVAACVGRLLEPGALPALLHCAVGKDRTGVTVAVILSTLGVADAHLLADYHLSNHGLGFTNGPVTYIDEDGVERVSRPVHPDLLALYLDRIRAAHGSAAGFLRAHGLTEAHLRRLRELLLEAD
ncbi:tyrosine-protein phosphatase [Streptacidiphilus monticola]|uniref:Tyrosine-protein phosphatase n=1 Tax=Streptacidiphilus monticola TaxID=2161674 RepID=A0ABW1G3Y0_9ACTN